MKVIIPLLLFIALFISGESCHAHSGPHHQDRQACNCCKDGNCVCRGYHRTGVRLHSSPQKRTPWIETYSIKTSNSCPCECRSKNNEEKKIILLEGNPSGLKTSARLISTEIDYPLDSNLICSNFHLCKEQNPSLRALRTVILLN